MRTHTVPEAARLRQRRKNYHLRVEIQNAAGAWVDYSNAYGQNWLRSVKWDDSIERRVMQGSVTFTRENRALGVSLAPTMTGSAANSGGAGILEGRGIRLYGAVTDAGTLPVLADWYELLRGEVVDVEYGKKAPNMTVGFRDIGARVLDCFINLERVYGSDGGVPVPTVMQEMINDNWDVSVNGPAPTLYVPTPLDSSFAVSPAYKQPQKSLLEALNDLAQQFGMVVRYKYDALGAFRLTLYDPQRTKVIPDAAFARGEYMELPVLRRSRDDVRNQILVLYRDAAGILQSYYEEDAASMAAYGPRYAQFGLNITSQIRTAAKAQAFAQAALSDLSTPLSTHQVESPLYWPVELGDLYTYASNERQYDQSQDLAVVSWEHSWTAAGKARTRIDTSGRVKGAVKQWIRNGGPIALDYFAPGLYAQFTYDDDARTADVTAYVQNNGNESIGLKVSDGNTADVAVLCLSAVDPTPKFVPSGSAIPPTEYFYLPGTGQIQRLNDIALQDFATTPLWLKAYGQLSGLESPWLTITLKQAIPLPSVIASVSAGNPVKGGGSYAIKLSLALTGGPNTASCAIRMVDIAADPADAIVDAVNIAPDEIVTRSYLVVASAAEILDKVWGAYLIASNKPLGYVPPPPALLGPEILVTSQGDTIAPADQEDMEAVQGDVSTLQTTVTGLAGAQFLVSAASAALSAERVVADDPTVAWDFATGGVARAYVPNLGIGTAQLGTGAVTTAKIANEAVTPAKAQASGTTPSADTAWFGDGSWRLAQVTGTTGPIQTQQTIIKVSGSLADGAGQTITLDIAPTVAFQECATSAGAWVRMYGTLAALNADLSRSFGTDPVVGSAGEPIWETGPGLAGFSLNTAFLRNRVGHNKDTPRIGRFYMRVTNKSGGTAAITTTIKYLPLEGIPATAPVDVTAGMLWQFDAQALVSSSGTPIGTVPNTGTVGGNFTNGAGSPNYPTYEVNAIGGSHPGLLMAGYGGAGRPYNFPSYGGATPTETHLFLVVRPTSSSQVGSWDGEVLIPSTSAGGVSDEFKSIQVHTGFTLGQDPSAGVLYYCRSKTGLKEVMVGATPVYSTVTNTLDWFTSGGLLGGYFSGGFFTVLFGGYLGECRIYTGPLTAAEVFAIQQVLATKWGVAL